MLRTARLTYRLLTRVMLIEYWPPPIGHGRATATLAKHAAPAGGAGVALGVVVGALVVVGAGVSLGVVVGARVVVGVGGGVAGGCGGGGAAPAWYQGVSPTVLCSQATLAHIICDARSRPSACAACSVELHQLMTWPPGLELSMSAKLHRVLCA